MHADHDHRMDSDDNASTLFLPDEAATLALGAALAQALVRESAQGLIIFLEGDLGAGKTTLVRGLLRALGYAGTVKSPTYTLVELYAVSGLNLYHFDFYRFDQAEEFLDAGLDEYFQGAGNCLVEWPEKAGVYLPPADLHLRLSVAADGRRAGLRYGSEKGRQCLTNWISCIVSIPGATPSSSPPPR
ncbi:MAG: tRNA (adenosine(37)-N6)-threonylcarbamoyltransferase complex ATPase subunit type 1 TsaE [Betaproteobacteria bacterium]|nr:tRNA (adenosine(37)-N6)-threonylcarbamoyltransferase complex ATPase subunit type 1 TsaE [Betaproteobacteria bacterium]